jgi:hypothetical protein
MTLDCRGWLPGTREKRGAVCSMFIACPLQSPDFRPGTQAAYGAIVRDEVIGRFNLSGTLNRIEHALSLP